MTVHYEATGKHVFGKLQYCGQNILKYSNLRRVCIEAVKQSGAIIEKITFKIFYNKGISINILLSESHLCVHTYPEESIIYVDIFTCGSTCNPEIGFDHIATSLNAQVLDKKIILR